MVTTRHDRFPLDWAPDRLRWLVDFDVELSGGVFEEFGNGDHYVITAEVPGVDPARDIEVTVSRGVLRIHVRRCGGSVRDDDASRSGLTYRELVRELTLPAGSREDGVSASYQNGLLEVNVPLDGEVKPDFIRVPIVAG